MSKLSPADAWASPTIAAELVCWKSCIGNSDECLLGFRGFLLRKRLSHLLHNGLSSQLSNGAIEAGDEGNSEVNGPIAKYGVRIASVMGLK